MERTPSLYIGKKPWYITYVGVDRATGEIVHEESTKPDPRKAQERADRLAAGLGLEKLKTSAGQDDKLNVPTVI